MPKEAPAGVHRHHLVDHNSFNQSDIDVGTRERGERGWEGRGEGDRIRRFPVMLPICLAVYQGVIFITLVSYTGLNRLASVIHL